MKVRVVAVGSTDKERQAGRWGVSFLLDDILFDTFGSEKVLFANMKKMGTDPGRIRHVVISHDHWDHTSGLARLLDINKKAQVYICPQFSVKLKKEIISRGRKPIEVNGLLEIKDNIFSSGPVKGVYAGKPIYEQALACRTRRGLTVICGCAHPGVEKMVNKIRDVLDDKVYAVLGGFHLKGAREEEIGKTINVLKGAGLKKVGPLHCTGNTATAMFRKSFKEGFFAVTERGEYGI